MDKSSALSLLVHLFYVAGATTGINSPMVGGDDENCVYTVFIRTGNIWKGGTDSKISLALAGSHGLDIEIPDLEEWGGLMGEGHNYFDRGNLDIFSGRGRCFSSPPCRMNLTSDGSGEHHGWYCSYVEVITAGPNRGCSQRYFSVEQWLATDASPYQLYATRDDCYPFNEDGFAGTDLFSATGHRPRGMADQE